MRGSYISPDNLRFPRSRSEGRTPHVPLQRSGPVYGLRLAWLRTLRSRAWLYIALGAGAVTWLMMFASIKTQVL